MRAYLSLFSLLFCFPLLAAGWVGAGGEALWWKATGADFQYVITDRPNGTQTTRVVADYDWGFRLFGAYYMECFQLSGDWTSFRSTDASSKANPDAMEITYPLGTLAFLGDSVATAHLRFSYDRVNLRIGRTLCSGFALFAGGAYVELKKEETFEGIGLDEGRLISFQDKRRFEGGGLTVGLLAEKELCWGFGIDAAMILSGLVGSLEHPFESFDSNSIARPKSTLKVAARTICVPAAQLRIGLRHTYQCDCWWILCHFGYQLDYYWNAVSQYTTTSSGFTSSRRADIGFGGLTMGVSFRF